MTDAELAAHYKAQRDKLLAFAQNAPVASGVCCCGDDMGEHSSAYDYGHSPVDQWDWSLQCWEKEFDEFDKQVGKET
jgi:hypothetical protein